MHRENLSPALENLLERAIEVLARLDPWLPRPAATLNWKHTLACRWRRSQFGGHLEAVDVLNCPSWDALQRIDEQKSQIDRNIRQFLAGLPANNVLLTGSRGCGKSSLVKALLPRHAKKGLRLVEVDKDDLSHLPDIVRCLVDAPFRFVLFTDDLSFEAGDPAYKPLKAALDGSVAGLPDNILICATSNRRHLMPEYLEENAAARHEGGEVRPADSVEEKVSLSDRFGLWLSFYPFSQDDYLAIAAGWIAALGGQFNDQARTEALQWAIQRGGRSGRIGRQFAADWVGRQGLKRR